MAARRSTLAAGALLVFVSAPMWTGCETLVDASFSVQRVTCNHRSVQPRPPPGAYGGSPTPTVLAVRRVRLGADGSFVHVGLDQDGLCTNRSQGPSCATPTWPSLADATDGDDGIDNGIGRMLRAQNANFQVPFLSDDAVNARIESGAAPPAFVVRISGYNGLLVDGDVKVELFLPAAIAAAPAAPPAWDSGGYAVPLDERTAREDANGDVTGLVVDESAYVNNGVLVAQFHRAGGQGPWFRLRNTAYAFESMTLTAPIPQQGHSFEHFDLAAKLALSEMFGKVGALTSENGNAGVCTDNAAYPQIKGYICAFIDLRVDGRVDANAPCDALGLGLSYDVAPAKLGPVVSADTPAKCPPATDPTLEDCGVAAVGAADGGAADPSGPNCVPWGTPNNDQGVGGACTKPSDCPGAFCSATFGAPAGAYFCTRLCDTAGASCGAGVHCVADAKGTACVPDTCVQSNDGGMTIVDAADDGG